MSLLAIVGRRAGAGRSPLALLLALLLLYAVLAPPLQVHSASLMATGVRYVAPGGACLDKSPCYAIVQVAVDAAAGGDVIKIAAGTYTDLNQQGGDSQVLYIDKDVTLRGGYSTANGYAEPPLPKIHRTILDAQEQGRVVVIDRSGPVLEGLVITGGAGRYSGGGVRSIGGSAKIRDCEIVDNSATGDGGGVFISGGSMTIEDCEISGNRADWGAGLRIINNTDVSVTGSLISANIASNDGGGMDIDCCGGSTPTIERNHILANQSGDNGGGVHVLSTNVLLVNNVIARNEAAQGAGVWLEGFHSYPVSAILRHNTMKGDSTGEAVGVGGDVDATLVNNIIARFAQGIDNTAPSSSTVSAQVTLFYNNSSNHSSGVTSTGEVYGAPLFLNAGADDYHIQSLSAAIDQGIDAGVTDDLDGRPRPIGSAPDIGADEWALTTYLPLTLRPG